jgi:hypothetical protein
MAIRWLTLVMVMISCLATAAPAAANPQFLRKNCDRDYSVCTSKCLPEIKQVPGKDGTFVAKADGRKTTQCKLKCIDTQNKCEADAAKATPAPTRSCTTNAQCGTGEGCINDRCMAL